MRELETILVTGGAGFIGSNLVRHLLTAQRDCRVVTLDALTYAGNVANLAGLPSDGRHVFIEADVRNKASVGQVLREYAVRAVVHLAAETHVDRSIEAPEDFVQTNVLGTLRLLEAVREVAIEQPGQIRRVVHVSTDEVYGTLEADEAAFTPNSRYAPRSPYSATKAGGDHLARAYFHTYGLPVVVTNCSNNYGPYQHPEKFIPLMIGNALAGEPLPVYGDGGQVRDWLYVEDQCAGLAAALENGQPGETYLFGGGNQISNLQLLENLCALLDELRPRLNGVRYWELIAHVPDRPGHDRRYAVDIEATRQALDWEPSHTLADGLRKTLMWYLGAGAAWLAERRAQPEYRAWLEKNYGQRGGSGE